jgi:hypothetical protein
MRIFLRLLDSSLHARLQPTHGESKRQIIKTTISTQETDTMLDRAYKSSQSHRAQGDSGNNESGRDTCYCFCDVVYNIQEKRPKEDRDGEESETKQGHSIRKRPKLYVNHTICVLIVVLMIWHLDSPYVGCSLA